MPPIRTNPLIARPAPHGRVLPQHPHPPVARYRRFTASKLLVADEGEVRGGMPESKTAGGGGEGPVEGGSGDADTATWKVKQNVMPTLTVPARHRAAATLCVTVAVEEEPAPFGSPAPITSTPGSAGQTAATLTEVITPRVPVPVRTWSTESIVGSLHSFHSEGETITSSPIPDALDEPGEILLLDRQPGEVVPAICDHADTIPFQPLLQLVTYTNGTFAWAQPPSERHLPPPGIAKAQITASLVQPPPPPRLPAGAVRPKVPRHHRWARGGMPAVQQPSVKALFNPLPRIITRYERLAQMNGTAGLTAVLGLKPRNALHRASSFIPALAATWSTNLVEEAVERFNRARRGGMDAEAFSS